MMNKGRELLKRATNPLQYDLGNISWDMETGLCSPTRKFFYDYLEKYKNKWQGAIILDIGCGTGWLMDLLLKNGAAQVDGIEPSRKNVRIAGKCFPNLKILQRDIDSFEPQKRYNLILAVMVFGHIRNLKPSFKKIGRALTPDGEVQIVIPDYDYFKQPEKDREIEFEELDQDEYVAKVTRVNGEIIDVVRKVGVYKNAAEAAGLKLVEDVPMFPTESLIASMPRFGLIREQTTTHLLRFKKATP